MSAPHPQAGIRLATRCMPAMASFLTLPCLAAADPARNVPPNWLSAVEDDIAAREYYPSWAERTPLADVPRAWQAANRAQRFRTYFTQAGIRTIPRETRQGESPAWEWGLQLCGWGRLDAMAAAEDTPATTNGNRVEYCRGDMVEWYVNDARGLEQGFTIAAPPLSPGEVRVQGHESAALRIELTITGNVTAKLTEEGAVDFFAPGGARVVHFAELQSVDATGTRLPAYFECDGPCVAIVVCDAGAVYPIVVDPLATSPSWTGESNQVDAEFGFSVAAAGDVNGDGYGDVIVGAHAYDSGLGSEGRAFVYHGSAAGLSATPAWTAQINLALANFGWSVATAGDVNGDGYSDVIVGAPFYDHRQDKVQPRPDGRAFVYHGSANGLSPTFNWSVTDQPEAYFGYSVAPAGDVNGDGFSDVIVGAINYDNGQSNEGAAFVYHGSAAGLIYDPAWSAEVNQSSAAFGTSVATAGDVNGDGFSDVVVGAYLYGTGGAGAIFAYHGSPAGLSAIPDWNIQSNQPNAFFGFSVATAGDVNGDGFSDVIAGCYGCSSGESGEGRAVVYAGSASGLASTPNWSVESNQPNAQFGYSVATAGDVNGDGFSDVIVGAPVYDSPENGEGRASLYYGAADGLSTTPAWTAEGNQAFTEFGHSVATAGDVNGDGISDVIVGASQYENGENNEGAAFVYHGSAASLSATASWIVEQGIEQEYSPHYAFPVATAGDVNGDGYSDVIIGNDLDSNGETEEGRALVFHGSASGLSTTPAWTAEPDQASAHFGFSVAAAGDVNGDGFSEVIVGAPGIAASFVYHGSALGLSATPNWTAEDQFADLGHSVATAGDVNGDGFSEVIVGAPYYGNGEYDEGRAYIYHGSAAGLSATPAWTVEPDVEFAYFGFSVATAGDVNGDGFSDVIIGAYGFNNDGRVYVYYGSAAGLGTTANWTADGRLGDNFGWIVATAGDVNGDGFSDIIIGNYSRRVVVYHGSAAGLGATPNWTVEKGSGLTFFGDSVATAGDVNADGFSDVIMCHPYYGAAIVYHGSAEGLSAMSDWIVASNEYNLDMPVSMAGDVNADGYSDVIIGENPSPTPDMSRAMVYYGNDGGGRTTRPHQRRTDAVTPIGPLGLSDSETQFRIGATMLTFFGRTRISMQHEVKPLGALFDGTGLGEGSFTDTGNDGVVNFGRLVTGLAPGTPYHWRVRARYETAKVPFQRFGPWITPANNGWNEADLRTAPAGAPNAAITGALSRKSCDLPVSRITGSGPMSSEPRQGGITELRIAFDMAPSGPGDEPVTIEQATCAAPAYAPYSGASISSATVVGNELVVTFTPGLDNARTYRVNIGPEVTNLAGQYVEVRGLIGDVNGDGAVNATDRSVVVGAWTGGGFTCATDVNNNEQTNATDRSIIVGAWTNPAANCAP